MKNTNIFSTLLIIAISIAACKKEENASPMAVACFKILSEEANMGDEISFTNCSQNAVIFTWDFGDGSEIVSDESPTHAYKTAGEYIVQMVSANASNSDTISKTVTINQINGFFLAEKHYSLQNAYWFDKNGEGISIWLGQTNPNTGADEMGSMVFYFSGFSSIPPPGTYIINNINGEGFYVISDPLVPGFDNTSVTLEISQTESNYLLEFQGKVEDNGFVGYFYGEINQWL